MPAQTDTKVDDPAASAALRDAVREVSLRYIATRRARVKDFCAQHFSWSGAAKINRLALGHDLWRAPLNILWAAPYLGTKLGAAVARRSGWLRTADRLAKIPAGWRTEVDREVEWLIYTELLELPISQGHRQSQRDALLEALLGDPVVLATLEPHLLQLAKLDQGDFKARLEQWLLHYTESRTAAAELATSLLQLAAGAAALQKFTPGAAALGQAAAGAIAQQIAIANFAFGSALGSVYYGLFPASASAGLVVTTVGGLLVALGIVSALTGFVTDPLQQAFGLHARRLNKLLDALESELTGRTGHFRLRDAYVSRVLDLADLLKSATKSLT